MVELNAAFSVGGIKLLREKAQNCPACIMSAILQATEGTDLNETWVEFDYKKEKADWEAEQHRLNWERVAF